MLLVILFLHLFLLVNTRFTLWPEMVVYPYLLNNGFLLYKEIINPYPPLFTWFLAAFAKVFGYNPTPYQILAWVIILITGLIIFVVTKKIFRKRWQAIVSTLFFIVFSIPFAVNGLWFDLIQTPLILSAFYYFYQYLKKQQSIRNLFFPVFWLSIALFIKQQVVWLLIWFLLVLIFKVGKRIRDVFLKNPHLLAIPLVLLFIQLFILWREELLKEFFFWVLYFPFLKASTIPGYVLFPTIRQLMVVLALFSIFLPLFLKSKFETRLIIMTALILVLFAYPRFDYFHLVPSLAVLSVGFGETFRIFSKTPTLGKLIFGLSLIFLSVFTMRYFVNNWHPQIRFFESEIITTAKFLEKTTDPQQPIYIQNGPDQLLPLAQRLPVKPWADEFPWYLELARMQERIIDGLKTQNPEFIVFRPYDQGKPYGVGSYRPQKIANFFEVHYDNLIQISDTLWLKVKK